MAQGQSPCVSGGDLRVLQEADTRRLLGGALRSTLGEGSALQSCPESGAGWFALEGDALRSRTVLEEGWGLSGWQQLGEEVLQL